MNGNMNLGKRVSVLEKDGGADIKKEISDLQVAVAETQNAITATQGEITNLENKVNRGHVYSTEEKVVGTWIGKPLYEKTIITEKETGFARSETIYQNDMENIISVEKVMFYNSGEAHWISQRFTVFPIGLDWNDNVVNFKHDQAGYDGAIKKIRFTIQYTKTTDNPTQ